jgi:hypothetical protein
MVKADVRNATRFAEFDDLASRNLQEFRCVLSGQQSVVGFNLVVHSLSKNGNTI